MSEGASRASFKELLEQLFEDAPLPLSVLDAKGNVVHENAAQLVFNQALGAEVGIGDFNSLDDLRSVEHGHAAHFRRALQLDTVEYDFSLPSNGPDGAVPEHAFQRLLLPMGGEYGRPSHVVSVIFDVTDRVQTEAEKARLNAQLLHAQKLESLGVLAGGIAHDFNNLLTGVLGSAEVLLDQLGTDEALRAPIETIQLAARRASEVAQQMLTYAGKASVERQLMSLEEALDDSIDLLRVAVGGRHSFSTELESPLPDIEGNATQIQQVVLNLVTNACESMPRRVGSVCLRTGVCELSPQDLLLSYHGHHVRPGRYVYVEVQDEGHGMDAETQRRIFDPFFSTKLEGRGLGLSSVLGIVQSHGAALQVHSASGWMSPTRLAPTRTPREQGTAGRGPRRAHRVGPTGGSAPRRRDGGRGRAAARTGTATAPPTRASAGGRENPNAAPRSRAATSRRPHQRTEQATGQHVTPAQAEQDGEPHPLKCPQHFRRGCSSVRA